MNKIIPIRQAKRKRIAVVGTGIAGLGAAWALRDSHDVTVFEKRARLGGHSATVDIDYDGVPIAVDTGFIVHNPRTYPVLLRLFAERLATAGKGIILFHDPKARTAAMMPGR